MKFQNFLSRTTGPNSIKLGTKNHLVIGIQVCENEGPHISQGGDNYEIAKLKKYSFQEPLGRFQPNAAQSILV